jgi:hypothetical protein
MVLWLVGFQGSGRNTGTQFALGFFSQSTLQSLIVAFDGSFELAPVDTVALVDQVEHDPQASLHVFIPSFVVEKDHLVEIHLGFLVELFEMVDFRSLAPFQCVKVVEHRLSVDFDRLENALGHVGGGRSRRSQNLDILLAQMFQNLGHVSVQTQHVTAAIFHLKVAGSPFDGRTEMRVAPAGPQRVVQVEHHRVGVLQRLKIDGGGVSGVSHGSGVAAVQE